MMKIFKNISLIFILMLAFIACGMGVSDWQIYNTASDQFITLATQYDGYYRQQKPEIQADWRAKWNPLFEDANKALTEWRKILDAGEDSMAQQKAFMSIKSELVALFTKLLTESQ